MKDNKTSVFHNAILVLIALCATAITVIMVHQLTFGNKQIASLEAELDSCKSQIESQANALTEAGEQLGQYEAQLAQYKQQLDSYAEKSKGKTYAVSSTKEYAAWVAAQTALEPHDLYDDLQYAYEQLVELDSEYYIGTEKYKATLNLLVPQKEHENLSSYMATLTRYFGTSDTSAAWSRFIDDLVSAKLLTDKGNNYYEWNTGTLNTKNVMSKLNLTEDVSNALLGLLRTMGWDV